MTRSRDLLSKTRCGLFTVHSKRPSPPILIATDGTQPLSKSLPECRQSIGGKGRSNLEKTTLIPCLVPRSINRSRLAIVLCYFSRYPPARCCRFITRSILQVYGGLSLSDTVPASTDRPALSPLSRRSEAILLAPARCTDRLELRCASAQSVAPSCPTIPPPAQTL
jgi:hypothetical protein